MLNEGNPTEWFAKGVFVDLNSESGWNTIDILTNPKMEDEKQAFAAGYLEVTQFSRFDCNIIKGCIDSTIDLELLEFICLQRP